MDYFPVLLPHWPFRTEAGEVDYQDVWFEEIFSNADDAKNRGVTFANIPDPTQVSWAKFNDDPKPVSRTYPAAKI